MELTRSTRPWMSVRDERVIRALLMDHLSDPLDCFEWGSGASTIQFGRLAKSWTAMEHNKEWADAVWNAGGNVVLANDPVSYCDPFHKLGLKSFDLIFVDGELREPCMMMAVTVLRPDGICICHDARRAVYTEGVKRFDWQMRVGDDLMVLAHKKPNKRTLRVLKKFELRGPNTGSYPWHPDHFEEMPLEWQLKIPMSGYCPLSYARH